MTVETGRRKQRKTRGKPTYVDVHVGQKVKQRRSLLGYSQERLASALDLTFQQVQKYERGANRVGAGRLYELAKALDVPVTYFFEDMPDVEGSTSTPAALVEETRERYDSDPLTSRETLTLVRSYYGITDPAVRRRLLDLIRAISNQSDDAAS